MKKQFLLVCLVVLSITACDENNNFIIFSVQDDITLGKQVSDEIAKDPTIKLLSRNDFPTVYNYLETMRDGILNSGEIAYANEFEWNLQVIQDDEVQNAFATPGGNIYIYTGLIKYLDHADDLAGVLGHEMAHADLRHTVRNLQRIYGVQILMNVVIGQDASMLEQIASQVVGTLTGLKFSREFESEADSKSVNYLSHTNYACNGAALFFVKLNSQNQASPPEFLSTHPNPENRIENINKKASELGCDITLSTESDYAFIKKSLVKG